jgi:putative ATP-dependent endonuclease of the OLD family
LDVIEKYILVRIYKCILIKYCPIQLRYNKIKHVNTNFNALNYRETKGCTYDRTLIYPTKDLEEKELVGISQLYRKMNDNFINDEIMTNVNKKLSQNTHILNTTIQLDTESLNQSDWEKSVITRINSTPFDFVGKGTQAAIKIELSLTSGKADKSSIILIEEPENHLTYSKMNKLISEITKLNNEKQIFITTHSSFVANKLNIKNLILLSKDKNTSFSRLTPETINFFEKKPGYDTLRLLLCKKAILVEGDADELIVQKAYLNKNGILPIENDIDVISVGNTFLRFLEISTLLEKETIVVTDNDGDIEQLKNKYENYLGKNEKNFIKICYDDETHIEQGNLRSKNGGTFNYDTLEPCMLRANNLDTLNEILETNKSTDDELIYYMVNNKTECALKIFDTTQNIKFPKYIEDSPFL